MIRATVVRLLREKFQSVKLPPTPMRRRDRRERGHL
jgi:hypothetical protein